MLQQDDIINALTHIPSDDRELWLKVGMAIKSELGDSGFHIWDDWSKAASSYKEKDALIAWRSFDSSGGITIATLFHFAIERGYEPKRSTKSLTLINANPVSVKHDLDFDRGIKADAAAKLSSTIWNKAQKWLEHAYIKLKQVEPLGARFQFAEHTDCRQIFWAKDSEGNLTELKGLLLLLPLYNITGELRGLQAIDEQGLKSFQKGISKTGLFMPLFNGQKIPPEYDGDLFLGEGFSTASTIRTAIDKPTIMAVDAGNLMHVARSWRSRCPNAKIIICGDVDKTGTGQKAAHKAATLCGGTLIFPGEFKGVSDFNDLFILKGMSEVRQQLLKPLPSNTTPKIKPLPLPDPLPAVIPLKPDMLPEAIRGFVLDASNRLQCPPDFVAIVAICGLSAILGRRVLMRPKQNDNWTVTPNLWGAIIGNPSAMKSPAMKEALKPLYKFETEFADQYVKEKRKYDEESEINKLACKLNSKEAQKKIKVNDRDGAKEALRTNTTQISPPIRKRIIINDSTVEKLGELLNENPNGLILVRDELFGWLSRMQKEEFQQDRTFYLECFDGDGRYTYDRINRGTIEITNCTLSIIGGIQPSRISPIIHKAMSGIADDGLIQRLQLSVWPDESSSWSWRDQMPDADAYKCYQKLFLDMHNIHQSNAPVPEFLHFSPEAQELYIEWMQEIQSTARAEETHHILESHILKMPQTIASLALLFELIHGGRQSVGIHATAMALDWADYLISHAKRLYSFGINQGLIGAQLMLKRKDKLLEPFTARQVYRKEWSGLGSVEAATEAIQCLIDHNYLQAEISTAQDAKGRPTITYKWVN